MKDISIFIRAINVENDGHTAIPLLTFQELMKSPRQALPVQLPHNIHDFALHRQPG